MGSANFLESYKTSRARVCVTVGMMTTGYDCPDILNLALMRPVFSPSDFVQIKGRGTRKHDFLEYLFDPELNLWSGSPTRPVTSSSIFSPTANISRENSITNEVLQLPRPGAEAGEGPAPPPPPPDGIHISTLPDYLKTFRKNRFGYEGMKIDRMFFNKFEDKAKTDPCCRRSRVGAMGSGG